MIVLFPTFKLINATKVLKSYSDPLNKQLSKEEKEEKEEIQEVINQYHTATYNQLQTN
ncbi:hypothetical protein U2I54_15965 [Bacillus pseudomycoides]|uniref:Uncharacterized protein n=1 Tax=Bacillus bingmayongensis TaxID=1150157 RepID=A0ABU5JYP3_9BACI|nr:hypothetical protein [Bacillus pseudomycoides]